MTYDIRVEQGYWTVSFWHPVIPVVTELWILSSSYARVEKLV
jgi:hypothetical protein